MLEDIENWAGDEFNVSKIHGSCKDDAKRKFSNFQELVEYRNNPDQELRALDFSMTDSKQNHISAKIGCEWNYIDANTAVFNLSGEDTTCIRLRQNIRNGMKSYRPWYWLLAKISLEKLFFLYIGLFSLYSVMKLAGVIKPDTTGIEIEIETLTTLIWVIIGITIAALFGLFHLGNFLKNHLFQPVIFSIGHGKERNENREWIRRSVVVLIIGVIVIPAIRAIVPISF